MPDEQQDWERAKAASDKYGRDLLAIDGVTGVATGVIRKSDKTVPCVKVYLKSEVGRGSIEDGKIPHELDGVPIDVVVSGEIRALGDD